MLDALTAAVLDVRKITDRTIIADLWPQADADQHRKSAFEQDRRIDKRVAQLSNRPQ